MTTEQNNAVEKCCRNDIHISGRHICLKEFGTVEGTETEEAWQKRGWWNRIEMEEKLQKEVTTLIRLTEMMPPESVSELFAITIPNLVQFMYKELSSARADEREKIVEAVKGLERNSWDSGIYNKALKDVIAKISQV